MKLFDWIDDRTGHRTWIRRWRDYAIDGPPSWTSAVGAAVLACLVLELTTGIALSSVYSADARSAWASVHFIQHKMPFGWLVRGIHHATADVLVSLLALWIFGLVIRSGYRRPKEVAFWIVLAYVPLTLGMCITGGLLPYDQLGYWARSVELNIAAMAPGGASIVRLATGTNGDIGTIALTRFQTLHVIVIPMVFVLLWLMRRSMMRKHAFAIGDPRRYFPGQFARDLAFACIAVAAVMLDVKRQHGVPIGHPADPASDYPARPEWFLLWMYELRHRMPKALEFWGTALIPPALGVVLALLPWVDRREASDKTGPRFRLRSIVVLLAVFGVIGWLEWSGMRRDARDAELHASLAKWKARADQADALAMNGVPPQGPLYMLDHDPTMRGEALFVQHCATCHVLQNWGDPKKPSAPALDGWSTEAWIVSMMHDPDHDFRFGKTPYKEQMPSMDVAPKEKPETFTPMPADEMRAAAAFLASQSDEPNEAREKGAARGDKALVEQGEKIVRDRCTSCHTFGGEGDDNGQNLAPELQGYGSVAWVRAQIANPSSKATYREGALAADLKGHMPRFDDDLSDDDLELLARWVRNRARATLPRK